MMFCVVTMYSFYLSKYVQLRWQPWQKCRCQVAHFYAMCELHIDFSEIDHRYVFEMYGVSHRKKQTELPRWEQRKCYQTLCIYWWALTEQTEIQWLTAPSASILLPIVFTQNSTHSHLETCWLFLVNGKINSSFDSRHAPLCTVLGI